MVVTRLAAAAAAPSPRLARSATISASTCTWTSTWTCARSASPSTSTSALHRQNQRRRQINIPHCATFSTSSTSASSSSHHEHEPQAREDLISELESRQLVATLTSRSLRTHLSTAPRVVYSGVDPSASSLHVGNLLPLFTLAHFARAGHKPIVLVGGATGSIGDPSGRSTERNALDKQTLNENVAGIKGQLRLFFSNVAQYFHNQQQQHQQGGETQQREDATEGAGEGGGKGEAVQLGMGVRLMNNYDWMKNITFLDFLGSVGRHARLTQMLARESVASRLAPTSSSPSSSGSTASSSSAAAASGGMSYTEFSYQLLQAYDFSHLHTTHNCTIQIGGSDQLGNITAGIDLIRRTTGLTTTDPAYGLTLPLLTTSSGEKFGKSAGNAVWLDRSRTSDLDFYQFFLRSSDQDVAKYLLTLTLLDRHLVESVMRQHEEKEENRKLRIPQRMLADHITQLIRGPDAMRKCRLLTQILYPQTNTNTNNSGGDKEETLKESLSKLKLSWITPEDNILTELSRNHVVGQDITKLFVNAGLVKSRAEAKRLLNAGGLYINNRQISTTKHNNDAVTLSEQDLVKVQVQVQNAVARGEEEGEGEQQEQKEHGLCLLRAGKGAVRLIHVTNQP